MNKQRNRDGDSEREKEEMFLPNSDRPESFTSSADFEKFMIGILNMNICVLSLCVLVFATALQIPKTDTFSGLYFFFAGEAIR